MTWTLTDELDLHTFRPEDVAELVADYLDECVARGFRQVRVIHGKGEGALRRTVHAVLDGHPAVERYQLAGATRGDWGATAVWLKSGA
jgi:dsDNA-specific endonuclease/ATPase MutS2